ncbi:MAG TPA: YibE/F family protein, partial [Euzebya sp.]|nr:YibE/F family protein [Euzebya sp.]
FLAYAGAALPLLILFSVGGAPVSETLSSELVAQEVVRTLVGSIGLVMAVPLTTAVAVMVTDADSPVPHLHGEVAAPATEEPDPARLSREPDAPAAASAQVTTERPTATDPNAAKPDDPTEAAAWEESLRRSYGLSDDT